MTPDRTWFPSLISITFLLGVGASAACVLLGSSFRDQPRTSKSFSLSKPPGRAPFAHHLPSLEAGPAVAERGLRCRVHGKELKSVLVPVEYGLQFLDDRRATYLTAANASLPHCDDAIRGGCIVGNKEDLKEVCQECNAARDKWLLVRRARQASR
jgi:hypothetical protein